MSRAFVAWIEQFVAEAGVKYPRIMRGNLDLGRLDRVQLIFARRVARRTPGRFRTRVLTGGVVH